MKCININTPEIKKLYQDLNPDITMGESISLKAIAAYVEAYQDKYHTEDFPSSEELSTFITESSANGASKIYQYSPEVYISAFEKAFNDPIERTNRINLIVSNFSQYVTSLIEERASKDGVDASSINRLSFIKEYGPDKILQEVKASYIDPYTTNGGYVDTIWGAVERNYPEFSEEQIEAKVLEIQAAYDKVSKFYWNLVSAARAKLNNSEGLQVAETGEQEDVENNPKEYFGLDITTVSGYKSLTALSRHFLSTIPVLDRDGTPLIDDLFQFQMLDPDYTYATLVQILTGTKNSTEMLDRMEENINLYPWLRGVIDRLVEDPDLATTLFSNLNKALMPYDVIDKKSEAVTLNINHSTRGLFNNITRNLQLGVVLNKSSIYNSSLQLLKENIDNLIKLGETATSSYKDLSVDQRSSYLSDPQNLSKIASALTTIYQSLGIPVIQDTMEQAIQSRISTLDPIGAIWNRVNTLLKSVRDNSKVKDTSSFLQEYRDSISKLIQPFQFISTTTESSTRVGGKSRYSYVLPSYISDLFTDLQDSTKYREILETKFKKFPFFYNAEGDYYYNSWLQELASEGNTHFRSTFRYKNVIHNSKGVPYSRWTTLDHIEVMLSEFGSFIKKNRPSYSSYMLPTMSDAATVLYVQAPRYDTTKVGNNIYTYKQQILGHLENVVYQELIKINDIIDRARRRKNGESIPVIDYYDGHPEFTFLPQLNTYKENGKSFIEIYRELYSKDKSKIGPWIQSVLNTIVDQEFQQFLTNLSKEGVFAGRIGRFSKTDIGEESFKKNLAAFEKSLFSKNPSILDNADVREILDRARKISILSRETEILEVNKALQELGDKYGVEASTVEFVSPVREELEHFFWNDYLANINAIELLTTTTQFYGSNVKFFKRGKEWYAATRKLDTEVKPNLSMAILSDIESEISPAYISEAIKIYDKAVADGTISKDIKDQMVKAISKINETDGQALMTLSTYRDIILASTPELWTSVHESAYQKQMGYDQSPYTAEELGVVYQTIKPFVYTQLDMSNGSKEAVMPLPFQNKNSIMVLTPPLVKGNPVLSGLYDFMTQNSLDFLQFESAVKVGIEGKLSIAGTTSKEIVDNLNAQYLENGVPKKGYNYIIDSRNFGIQQETPPHYLNTSTNIGVQMRRITYAYMSPEDKTRVDELTVENVKEEFRGLTELYGNPKNLYDMLSRSLLDDGRSSSDTVKALTPDIEGNIPIPICNPLTSGVVLPRVIAPFKKIVQQTISGGALIQATSVDKLTVKGDDSLRVIYNKDGGIEIECYVPASYRELLEDIIDWRTGELDINAVDKEGNPIVPEEMRKLIAFRIPSEGANSIVALRIKGFLPVSAGGMIITNPIVFTLTGSDLDVDKLFFYKKAFHKEGNKYIEDSTGRTGRDNVYFNILYKTITSGDYAKDMLNISNFDPQKKAARILEILENPDIPIDQKDLLVLQKKSIKELTSLAETAGGKVLGIASAATKLETAIRNMTGKNLIAMIANHVSNAFILRDTPAAISSQYRFSIDQQSFSTINYPKAYLSVKQYESAVVDNAKDPVLGSIGATETTIQAIMAMVRAGFKPLQIGLLFRQPSFRACIEEFNRSNSVNFTKFLSDFTESIAKKRGIDLLSFDSSLTTKELADSITGLKSKDKNSYYSIQLKALVSLTKAFKVGDYLAEYVGVSRYDSKNNAPSLSLERITAEISRVEGFYRKPVLIKLPRLTTSVYSASQAEKSIEFSDLPIKWIQAMFGYSYGGSLELLSRYYPQLNPTFIGIRNTIGLSSVAGELSEKEMAKINTSLMEYLLSSSPFPASDKDYFTKGDFEAHLVKAMQQDPELNENLLLKYLFKNKLGLISLEDGGSINPVARERLTNAWRGLVMSDNPTYKQIGLDLIKYCVYNYGIGYAPGSFIHIAPLEGQLLLPGYVETLRKIEANRFGDIGEFLPQFYLNNLSNENFVPTLPNTIEEFLAVSDDSEKDSFVLPDIISDSLPVKIKSILYPKNRRSPGAFKVLTEEGADVYLKYKEIESGSGILTYYKKVKVLSSDTSGYSYGSSVEELLSLMRNLQGEANKLEPDPLTEPVPFEEKDSQYEGAPADIPDLTFSEDQLGVAEAIPEEWMSAFDINAAEAAFRAEFDKLEEPMDCNII